MRVNERIRVPQVRLVGTDGELIGILPTRDALVMAQEQGLDLVEVAAKSRPPVCRIMDVGKFKYEQSKKARKAKRKQHTMQLKEIKIRPKIEDHDYQFKLRHAREFLEHRDKVKVTLTYRGREMAHMELGQRLLDKFVNDLLDISNVEQTAKLEGRNMTMVLIPKPQLLATPRRPHGEGEEGHEDHEDHEETTNASESAE